MNSLRTRIAESETRIKCLKEDEANQRLAMERILPEFNQFKSWAEEFENATLEQKKMIACQLFKRIEVGRDYKINFEMNLSYREFCSEWNAVEDIIDNVG